MPISTSGDEACGHVAFEGFKQQIAAAGVQVVVVMVGFGIGFRDLSQPVG